MRSGLAATVVCVVLSGCLGRGEPPAGVPDAPAEATIPVSEITPAQEDAVLTALAETPRRKGLRALFSRKPEQPEADILVAEADETAPAVAVTKPEDGPQAVVDDAIAVAVAKTDETAQKPRRGLFGLFAKDPEKVDAIVAEPVTEPVSEAIVAVAAEAAPPVDMPAVPQATVEPQKRAGLLGGLFGPRKSASQDPTPQVAIEPKLETASLDPKPQEPARRGVFGKRSAAAPSEDLPAGTILPFGRVGVTCSVKGRALGKEVARAPESGKARYRLFDSRSGTTGPRTFYVTGFQDGCARQVTASVVVFGDINLYELVQYGGGAPSRKSVATDKAYRKIRVSACGGARKGPCSAKGAQTLGKRAAFLSVYETEGSARYFEVLLDQGEVLASALR